MTEPIGILCSWVSFFGGTDSVFGLGRTVGRGSSNGSPSPTTQPPAPVIPDSFEDKDDELRDLLENQIDDRPTEVPPGKKDGASPVSTLIDNLFYVLADRPSWNSPIKTLGGAKINHIATQESRRRKRTIHVYHIEGTNAIVYNRSRNGVYFMRIAIRPENVIAFYDVFVREPLTAEEKTWLERNDYVLTN